MIAILPARVSPLSTAVFITLEQFRKLPCGPVARGKLLLSLLLAVCAFCTEAAALPRTLYVAREGNDSADGSAGKPFATLNRARHEIRQLKSAHTFPTDGIIVELRGGIYELTESLDLGATDSGLPTAPIIYRSRAGEEVRIVGGKVLNNWSPVTDPAILARLDEGARGHVLQTDIGSQHIPDPGEMNLTLSFSQPVRPGLELFFDSEPMTLARWPNQGSAQIVDVLGPTPVNGGGWKGKLEGIFSYDGDRPKRWTAEKEIILHGFWIFDWADQRQRVQSIDTEKRVITLRPPYEGGYRAGQWFYAYNLLAELDRPGEWFLDRDTSLLYFWPPGPIENGKPMVSMLPSLLNLTDASFIIFQGITFECVRDTAVNITRGTGVRLVGCVIRNTGNWGVKIDGGSKNGLVGCDILGTADGGVRVSGGDRPSLTPSQHFVENCHIHRFGRFNPMYQPGIVLNGVGNRASHNLIHDGPHIGINFNGNDHVIEYNEIHSVVTEANDAGTIYSGQDWTGCGTVVRYNYLHHIYGRQGRGAMGVYLDDNLGGITIFGNVFQQVPSAVFIGGGRDNVVENNLFLNCSPALWVDARGLDWRKDGLADLKHRLEEMPTKSPPWSTRYPKLATILEDEPMAPKGNIVIANISSGGRWTDVKDKAKPFVDLHKNWADASLRLIEGKVPGFELPLDSPAWGIGFKKIPIEKIGLYRDEFRASWPVENQVRPAPESVAKPNG